MGHHQQRLLRFAIHYPGSWHTYGSDDSTRRAINSLVGLGVLQVNDCRQFRLTPPAYNNDLRCLALKEAEDRKLPTDWKEKDKITQGLALALAELNRTHGISPVEVAVNALEDLNAHDQANALRDAL